MANPATWSIAEVNDWLKSLGGGLQTLVEKFEGMIFK
jgi:hypothetical protein